MDEQSVEPGSLGPIRVLSLSIPSHQLSEELFGPGIGVQRCRVVFRQMLPAPAEATLQAVLGHGLALTFPAADPAAGEEQPTGLLVPWGQISYVTFFYR
jgi:hypothetical protein